MNEVENKSSKINCWECVYNDLSGNSFLGICTWFEKHNRGKNKEIPPNVVDVGCKHFTSKRTNY